MELRGRRIRQEVGNRGHDLVLHRRRDLVLAGHQRIKTGLGDHAGIVLAVRRAGLGVHHVRALEEIRFRHAGHQHGDADARVLRLLAQRLAEPAQEHLGAAIHRLEGIRHGGGDGGGEQDPPGIARHHVLQNQLGELHGPSHVDVDHRQLALEVGVGKRATQAEAGIDAQRIHRPCHFADRKPEQMPHGAFFDTELPVTHVVAQDDKVLVHLRMRGRHTGTFSGTPATGSMPWS